MEDRSSELAAAPYDFEGTQPLTGMVDRQHRMIVRLLIAIGILVISNLVLGGLLLQAPQVRPESEPQVPSEPLSLPRVDPSEQANAQEADERTEAQRELVASLEISAAGEAAESALSDIAQEPDAIDVLVRDWVGRNEEPWMLSGWRMSQGTAIHAKREVRSDGGVRIVIDDANGYSWDTVTIDLSKGAGGLLAAKAKMNWTKDFGPPFDGSVEDLTGSVYLSSADLADAQPLFVQYELRGWGEHASTCEHGLVPVP